MVNDAKYDLIIIGGGAAAFSAAIKANTHGVKTAMIERAILGGTCVNVGCVPSKNLLGAGEIIHSAKYPVYHSISSCELSFDFSKTIANKGILIKRLRRQKYYDVISPFENLELIEANVSFISDRRLKVNSDNNKNGSKGKILEADKFIIATGSSPSIPSFKGIDRVDYLTNNEALSLIEKPLSMIVVGGGPLGLEFAQMYSRFGTKVTLLQRSNRIIPYYEPEISEGLSYYLAEEEEGIEIVTGVEIKEVYQKNGSKLVTALVNHKHNNNDDDGESKKKEKTAATRRTKVFEAEQLLMATGRRPNTTDLHLENTGVKTRENDGAIVVNPEMHTTAPHIWA